MGIKGQDFQAVRRFQVQHEDDAHEKMRVVLDVMCAMVADVTGASSVLVSKRNPQRKTIQVRGSVGTMIKELDMRFALPALDPVKSPTLAVEDIRFDERFRDHPMLKLAPHVKAFIAILLPGFKQSDRAVLYIMNPKRAVFTDAAIWRELSNFTKVFAGILGFETDMALVDDRGPVPTHMMGQGLEGSSGGYQEAASASHAKTGDPSEASVNFLFDTLLKKRNLHSRKGVDYLTLRSWRTALKSYQIASLISLKVSKPYTLVRRAADEICEAVRLVHGEGVISAVVPIPSGSSADAHSFAVQLAQEVASELNVPFHDILVPQGQKGKSAPIKSASLKPYVVKEIIAGPILVVDDVTSSGTHMELAINALRQNCKAVYGVAWIGK